MSIKRVQIVWFRGHVICTWARFGHEKGREGQGEDELNL